MKICDKNLCTGCSACRSVCPQKAIEMKSSDYGFLIPIVDNEKCISCGLCKEVCQANKPARKNSQIKIYACKNKNEEKRITSSSGGVFQEFSKFILEKGGNVYGAVFDDNIEVIHQKVNNIEDIEKIKKSKYVQSNMENVVTEVREDILEDKFVLFSGTPCQVQALNSRGLRQKENLYTIDLVCHGVPSPKIFDEYKKFLESKYNSKIIDVNFRWKDEVSTQNIKIKFENGQEYISNKGNGDIYYNLFLDDIILRDSCYSCQFRDLNRVSDISIADFWGLEKGNYKDFYDKKGVSLVLINTEKGLNLFEAVKENLDYIEIYDKEFMRFNSFKQMLVPEERQKFWEDYKSNGFKIAINNYNN